MESLTLNDGQLFSRHPDYYWQKDTRHRSPRLLTPENSRSGDDAFDSSPMESELPVRELLLRPSPTEGSGMVYTSACAGPSRHHGQSIIGPESPPYRLADAQKPSLPPLKYVLGDKINSPPRTPSPDGITLQLSPREPSYTTATYRPPSLYPNKKQRTESFPTSTQQGNGSSGLTLETIPNGLAARSNVRFPPLSASLNSIDTHRGSDSIHSSPWTAQHSVQHSKPASHHANHDTATRHYRTPEQASRSTMLEPSFLGTSGVPVRDPFVGEMRNSFAHAGDRPLTRRASESGYGTYTAQPSDAEIPTNHPHHQGTKHQTSTPHGYADGRRTSVHGRGEEHGRYASEYEQVPYQSNMPAFFMPGHYEYQHGKARKRSNLPKQSTEIMKTWFDQNITNPYPSEEQKAIFSNATGISMTQVSNWFINHRRRCPELRDKREKNRNGREGDI